MSADSLRGHTLMPKNIVAEIPDLYATDNEETPHVAYVKLFSPYTNWYWYIMEFDGVDTCFGYVYGWEEEYGYFNLSELVELMHLDIVPAVERDLSFEPKLLKEVFADHEKWKK